MRAYGTKRSIAQKTNSNTFHLLEPLAPGIAWEDAGLTTWSAPLVSMPCGFRDRLRPCFWLRAPADNARIHQPLRTDNATGPWLCGRAGPRSMNSSFHSRPCEHDRLVSRCGPPFRPVKGLSRRLLLSSPGCRGRAHSHWHDQVRIPDMLVRYERGSMDLRIAQLSRLPVIMPSRSCASTCSTSIFDRPNSHEMSLTTRRVDQRTPARHECSRGGLLHGLARTSGAAMATPKPRTSGKADDASYESISLTIVTDPDRHDDYKLCTN